MTMTEWLINNWEYVLVGFYAVEKLVLLSPTKYDDMLWSMFVKPMFNKLAGKKQIELKRYKKISI